MPDGYQFFIAEGESPTLANSFYKLADDVATAGLLGKTDDESGVFVDKFTVFLNRFAKLVVRYVKCADSLIGEYADQQDWPYVVSE